MSFVLLILIEFTAAIICCLFSTLKSDCAQTVLFTCKKASQRYFSWFQNCILQKVLKLHKRSDNLIFIAGRKGKWFCAFLTRGNLSLSSFPFVDTAKWKQLAKWEHNNESFNRSLEISGCFIRFKKKGEKEKWKGIVVARVLFCMVHKSAKLREFSPKKERKRRKKCKVFFFLFSRHSLNREVGDGQGSSGVPAPPGSAPCHPGRGVHPLHGSRRHAGQSRGQPPAHGEHRVSSRRLDVSDVTRRHDVTSPDVSALRCAPWRPGQARPVQHPRTARPERGSSTRRSSPRYLVLLFFFFFFLNWRFCRFCKFKSLVIPDNWGQFSLESQPQWARSAKDSNQKFCQPEEAYLKETFVGIKWATGMRRLMSCTQIYLDLYLI